VFHRDVAKVDQNVAYVASVSEACCKRWFKMFYLFQTYVASVFYLDVAHVSQEYVQNILVLCCNKCFHVVICKCFIWMLHIFHTHGAIVCSKCFSRLLYPSVSCFRGRVSWGA
jgi:hypothetical protein